MTFERCPLLLQKYIILQKVGKKYLETLNVHEMIRERFNMSR